MYAYTFWLERRPAPYLHERPTCKPDSLHTPYTETNIFSLNEPLLPFLKIHRRSSLACRAGDMCTVEIAVVNNDDSIHRFGGVIRYHEWGRVFSDCVPCFSESVPKSYEWGIRICSELTRYEGFEP